MTDASDCRWTEVAPDYWGRLQDFSCATEIDAFSSFDTVKRHGHYYPVFEWEVQSTIRNFRACDAAKQWAEICVSKDKQERIWSFVWFGVVGGKKRDANGSYMIGYIARSLETQGCHFGDATLHHALAVLKKNQKETGRRPVIGARIDPMNLGSINLFKRNGFIDMGVDPEATEYHRWVRIGFDDI
ncbi:hypothetical protein OZX62_05890 [Bifidobacterium sp. ESL0690]|uniref:hypothetical protein n=1 Tax=Bifidobacterium sp. ESL0690 TaxID=2983214 RepID=UPI0023F9DBB8|nr:hypothetical protein [Bifidobacterium sp. ESL0690]WEV45998.1 hypothetical protein OZX62_05890 [Bifidobacterium sp. ESL0690]